MTDKISCKVLGIPKSRIIHPEKPTIIPQATNARQQRQRQSPSEPNDEIQTVRINGINCNSDAIKVKIWLALYGELLSDITEDFYHETNPDAQKIGNGIHSVQMKIKKPIPNFLPCLGLKIRICYKDCILLCPHCYRVHPRGTCKNAKLTWIGYWAE